MSWLLSFLVLLALGVWLVVARRRRVPADPRLDAFHREVTAACDAGDGSAVERLRARREALGLSEDEAAIEIEMIDGLSDLLAFRGQIDHDGLPALETHHRVLGTDRCYFETPAFLPDKVEANGKVFMTGTRLVFLGGGVTSVPWNAISRLTREGRDLVAVVPSRDAVYRFRCNAFSESMRGAFIADRLITENRARRAPGAGQPPPGPA